MPAAAAGGLLAIVVVAGVALGGGGGGDEAAPAVTAESVALDNSVPASVDVIATVETSTPITKTVLARTLSKGMAGDDVAEVQQRLTDLGFWPGPVDGYFGDETRRSVWAYEKLVLGVAFDEPTGAVTPDMWTDMQDPFVIQPRRTEVDAEPHGDLPARTGHRRVPERRAGDDQPHVEWRQRGLVRGSHDQPRRVQQSGRRTARARRMRQVDHARWRLQLQADGRRRPSGLARRHVGSGVLQLRHRRARCAQRAAAARLARLHPHPVVAVARRSRISCRSATRSSCSTA